MEYEPTETASRHRLDNLPIEVIHRIVVTGSCKTTLSFAAANRRLHSICYQHLLFRKLVEARHGESLSEPMSWWKRATGSNSKDIGLAARWAFADELASGFTSRTCSSPMSAKTLEWVIPLLIVGRKLYLCSATLMSFTHRARSCKPNSASQVPQARWLSRGIGD